MRSAPQIPDGETDGTAPALVTDLRQWAVLLDVDGTLLDIAPLPQQVAVPAGLRGVLSRLAELTDGAVALVSGRSIGDIDLIFSPLQLAAIGVHGAEMRIAPDAEVQVRVTPLSQGLKARLAAVAERDSGLLVEDKGYSIALHYRRAPETGPAVLAAVTEICAHVRDEHVEILPGKLVVEVKPAGTNKGSAVSELMKYPPFAGRRPVFIGDDVTDVAVFRVLPGFHGRSYAVGGLDAEVDGRFDSPQAVRAWLARLAGEQPDAQHE